MRPLSINVLARSLLRELQCCTTEQFREWAEYAPRTYQKKGDLLNLFCSDCTSQYRKAMTQEHRCIRPIGWVYRWDTGE